MLRYLGPISFARGQLVICILIRRHTIIVRLVVVLAVTAMPYSHALQDKFNIVWKEGTQSEKVTAYLFYTSVSKIFGIKQQKMLTFGAGY